MENKVLYYQDKNAREVNRKAWETERLRVCEVVDLYNQTKLSPLSKGDLGRLVNNTINFLFDKLTGGNDAHLSIGTGDTATLLPVIKSKAIDMLQKPKGYNELMEGIKNLGIEAFKGHKHNGDIIWQVSTINNYFDIDDNGEVVYTESLKNKIDDYENYYISNERGKKMLNFLEAVAKAFYENGIDEIRFNGIEFYGASAIFTDAIEKMDHKNKKWHIHKSYGNFLKSLG